MRVDHTDAGDLLSKWFFADDRDEDEAPPETHVRHEIRLNPDAPTILVVDDDLANLALAEALLQRKGSACAWRWMPHRCSPR
jgi:hypothetical protein